MIIGPVIKQKRKLYGGASYHREIIAKYGATLRSNVQRGFMTDDGKFLSRTDGAAYVVSVGQKLNSSYPDLKKCSFKLHSCAIRSEDLDIEKVMDFVEKHNRELE